ncbi:RpiR family transcriptional regulator [Mycoplasmopsis mustelae]|uniref:RpiR family transcriptional regulator n=1 Tax=Mycoplasmopsis mustelae TaxID=171289 RepID=A0A4V3FNZ4_9BACT|nr:MurR/RpiR family transcriptional regulator [Mycoplasmopsis mustelae]TDV24490.1 RpiR family transcriptional regulator [Mycoplasmopsis mustelae]
MNKLLTTFFSKNQLDKLTKTELNLINYASNYPEEFYKCSIKQLANKVDISMSVISKLVKKLNFDSLKDMQFFVYHNFLNTDIKNTENIDYQKIILKQLFLFYRESISKTSHLIDLNQINRAINSILDSERIYLYGAGSSYLSASELGINLAKIGINAIAFRDFHSLLLTSSQKDIKNKLVILFSKSCDTKEIKFAIELFVLYKIKFWLITANKQIKNKLDNVILYSTLEQNRRFVSISSKINQQFIADLLFLFIQRNKVSDFEAKYAENIKVLEFWNKK